MADTNNLDKDFHCFVVNLELERRKGREMLFRKSMVLSLELLKNVHNYIIATVLNMVQEHILAGLGEKVNTEGEVQEKDWAREQSSWPLQTPIFWQPLSAQGVEA